MYMSLVASLIPVKLNKPQKYKKALNRKALSYIGDGAYKFTQEDPVKVTIHSCTVEVGK